MNSLPRPAPQVTLLPFSRTGRAGPLNLLLISRLSSARCETNNVVVASEHVQSIFPALLSSRSHAGLKLDGGAACLEIQSGVRS